MTGIWRRLRPLGVAFALGVLMGGVYWLIRVPSPAPIPVALVGLAGMVIGERAARGIRRAIVARRTISPGDRGDRPHD